MVRQALHRDPKWSLHRKCTKHFRTLLHTATVSHLQFFFPQPCNLILAGSAPRHSKQLFDIEPETGATEMVGSSGGGGRGEGFRSHLRCLHQDCRRLPLIRAGLVSSWCPGEAASDSFPAPQPACPPGLGSYKHQPVLRGHPLSTPHRFQMEKRLS